ncbi:MAG TPA: flagellin, partial [Spirochaetota bacterium]|nr:flagellin [Spirochaetota bacterium]
MDQREKAYIGTMTAKALGVTDMTGQMVSISTPDEANKTIGVVDEALKKVNKQRADLGAYQNRLEHVMAGNSIGAENLQAAESRIRDTNMAMKMSEFVKNQILRQAGVAMVAQANMKGESALRLLQ